MTDAESPIEFSPAEAFALLGDETRVAILEALAQNRGEGTAFATLRDRVGVADSGRFNYHLKKLVGRFVRKDEDGYQLTYAGSRVVGAVYEGTYARGQEVEPFVLDEPCPRCGGDVEFRYADERIHVNCRDCDALRTDLGFPPGAVAGRDRRQLPALLSRHLDTLVDRLAAGFCPNCSGPVHFGFGQEDHDVSVDFRCERCGEGAHIGLASVLTVYPPVVAFHYDHGVDLREAPPWTLTWVAESQSETVSTEPPRYAVTSRLDDELLRVVVDGDLDVVETERFPAE